MIVVGLGIAGLMTAYEGAKRGLKVLGLEKNPYSGDYLTASHGDTRQWGVEHINGDPELGQKAIEKFKAIEKESGIQFLSEGH